MKKDANNLPVTATTSDEVDAINHFANQMLYSGTQGDRVLVAADNYPANLLLQAYAAAFYLYAQENIYTAKALSYLSQAEKLLNKVSLREQLFYQAVNAWYRLDYELAITLLTAIIDRWPTDCVAAKIAEWLFYCTGQAYQAKRFLHMFSKIVKKNQANAGILASYSFALELNKKYDKAYSTAMTAMELQPSTPWAHHTLTHVFLLTGQFDKGIKVLNDIQPSWEPILPPLREHNNWHLALLHLANLDTEKVMQLYKTKIWGNQPQSVSEQIGAISLLWRLELAGANVKQEWKIINNYLQQHSVEHYMPFNNAHFIYALCQAGEMAKVNESIQATERFANNLVGAQYKLWMEVTIPLLKGICAYVKADYQQAYRCLHPVMLYIYQVGGSDAQDELFLQTYLQCLIRSGRAKMAKKYFDNNLNHYSNAALGACWLSQMKV